MSPDTIHCLYSFKFLEMLKVTHHLATTITVVVVRCGTLYFVTVLLLTVIIIILILVHKRRVRPTEKDPFSDYVLPPHMPAIPLSGDRVQLKENTSYNTTEVVTSPQVQPNIAYGIYSYPKAFYTEI